MAASRIIFGETILINLTEDTVNENSLLEQHTAHDEWGESITGRLSTDNVIHIEHEGAVVIEEEELLVLQGENDIYDGSYLVRPEDFPQALPTENKYMEEDVIIEEVPYQKVTNLSGGYTVMIG